MNVAKRPSKPSVAKQSRHRRRPAKPPRRPARPLLRAGGGGTTTGLRRSYANGSYGIEEHLPDWIASARSCSITISWTSDGYSNSWHFESSLKMNKEQPFTDSQNRKCFGKEPLKTVLTQTSHIQIRYSQEAHTVRDREKLDTKAIVLFFVYREERIKLVAEGCASRELSE